MKIPSKIRIPRRLKNRYAITGILFIVWVLFFDGASVTDWFSQMSENKVIRKDIEFYDQQALEVGNQLKHMHANNDSIEKYAREAFYMKRTNEEIFIIE